MEWNKTDKEFPGDHCIHELIREQAERTPEAVAVVFENSRLTYGELNRRANQLAHFLRSRGVGPETLVGICLERSLEMVVAVLGSSEGRWRLRSSGPILSQGASELYLGRRPRAYRADPELACGRPAHFRRTDLSGYKPGRDRGGI